MEEQESAAPYAHWMLREIYEQPETLARTFARYVRDSGFTEEMSEAREWLAEASDEIVIVASGSSRHAGMVAELLIEDLSGIAVDVEYASEYTYRSGESLKKASVMVISQSGETADTLAAMRRAAAYGRKTLAVTNVAGSRMMREATVSLETEAGRERAIPATKSFTAQLMVVHLLALLAGEVRGTLSAKVVRTALRELETWPAVLKQRLSGWQSEMEKIAVRYGDARSFLFLGRGLHYPIAREGALKLKESSYIHAEGYPSGELKHGPNAIVNEETPLVMLATLDREDADSVLRYEKVVQLMDDMRRQGARILCVATEGDSVVTEIADDVVFVPALRETVLPLAEIVPLQMFAYFMAVQAGIDVDRPRNLVKAVVAE